MSTETCIRHPKWCRRDAWGLEWVDIKLVSGTFLICLF